MDFAEDPASAVALALVAAAPVAEVCQPIGRPARLHQETTQTELLVAVGAEAEEWSEAEPHTSAVAIHTCLDSSELAEVVAVRRAEKPEESVI